MQAIRQWGEHSHETMTLLKSTSNLFRHRQSHARRIDVRAFNEVLWIDPQNETAEVEGMTTYETLVSETLRYGYLPAVVPELKTITVGGALAGVGIESSSFRYGLVHETILQFDVVLADGAVQTCRPDNEHRDLFYAFPNSYGTLGYAIKITVKLIPCKKYIQLTYQHFTNAEDFFKRIEQLCLNNNTTAPLAYVDAVIFADNHQVIITGEWADDVPKVSNYRFMHIYYQAIKTKTHDYLTTEDYIWRWDSDWFWCSKVFHLQNPILRCLIGKWMLKSKVYSWLMRLSERNKIIRWWVNLGPKKESVIQDVAIPIHRALDYLRFFQNTINILPIWICPVRPASERPFDLFRMTPGTLYINFGFWDSVASEHEEGYYNRLIEKKVAELGGNKSLYSNVFYTEEEFWKIYDKPLYKALKQKYDPQNKLNTIDKKCTEK
ncbi:MAG: hypothetical protein A3F41_06540 [Coxiella sp. RIFCSPHIGHO2_12_FULL_44_14]|nr:MAG: hypothetical protein A3F41_06540 [Coxiella sp. RIFCSPHIGHO2_12_FULL_44_14]